MSDFFSQFRQATPAKDGSSVTPSGEKEPYIAFKTRDHVQMMRIVISPELDHSPSISTLVNVSSDNTMGTKFIIAFYIMWVEVQGRNLQSVVLALRRRSVECLQQFDSRMWTEPTDPNAPVISSITVHFKENACGTTNANSNEA